MKINRNGLQRGSRKAASSIWTKHLKITCSLGQPKHANRINYSKKGQCWRI